MKTLDDLAEYAKRWGWTGHGDFWQWVTLQLVGYHRWELELAAEKAASSQFTRRWYADRAETMDKWMREKAPAEVREAYFCIVANGSAQFIEAKHLELPAQRGHATESLLEQADNAVRYAQDTRAELAQTRVELAKVRGEWLATAKTNGELGLALTEALCKIAALEDMVKHFHLHANYLGGAPEQLTSEQHEEYERLGREPWSFEKKGGEEHAG